MLESLSQFMLLLSSPVCIICFIAFGYWSLNNFLFTKIATLVLLSLIFNPLLKNLYGIDPLPLHDGYRFPSGHMQFMSSIILPLAHEIKPWFLKIILFLILLLYGLSIVINRHHLLIDIIAGVSFSYILLYIGNIYVSFFHKLVFYRNILYTSIALLSLIICQLLKNTSVIWPAFFGLVLICIWSLVKTNQVTILKEKKYRYAIPILGTVVLSTLLLVLENTKIVNHDNEMRYSVLYILPICFTLLWPSVFTCFSRISRSAKKT